MDPYQLFIPPPPPACLLPFHHSSASLSPSLQISDLLTPSAMTLRQPSSLQPQASHVFSRLSLLPPKRLPCPQLLPMSAPPPHHLFEGKRVWESMKGKRNKIPHNSLVLKPSVTP